MKRCKVKFTFDGLMSFLKLKPEAKLVDIKIDRDNQTVIIWFDDVGLETCEGSYVGFIPLKEIQRGP